MNLTENTLTFSQVKLLTINKGMGKMWVDLNK